MKPGLLGAASVTVYKKILCLCVGVSYTVSFLLLLYQIVTVLV